MFEKRYKTAKWLCFTLLIYGLAVDILCQFVDTTVFGYLSPVYLLQMLLHWWIEDPILLCAPLITVFALLPLCGWFLLSAGKKAGKYIIITVNTVLICINLTIFMLHLINALYMFRASSLVETIVSFLTTTIYCTFVITLTMIWFPKRDF